MRRQVLSVEITINDGDIQYAVDKAIKDMTLDEEQYEGFDEPWKALDAEISENSYREFICSHPIDPTDPAEFLAHLIEWM